MLPMAMTVARAGAGQGREERAGQDHNDRQTAADIADERFTELRQPLGDAALRHQVAAEDKQRDRHNGEGVERREDFLADDRQRVAKDDQTDRRGDAEAEGHGDLHDQKECEHAEQDQCERTGIHYAQPPSSSVCSRFCSRMWKKL